VGSTVAGLLLHLEPLVGMAGSAVFLGEGLSPATLAGGPLIMLGVGTAWLSRR
jgi:drug/metabolite transporter (DMT)-like permease